MTRGRVVVGVDGSPQSERASGPGDGIRPTRRFRSSRGVRLGRPLGDTAPFGVEILGRPRGDRGDGNGNGNRRRANWRLAHRGVGGQGYAANVLVTSRSEPCSCSRRARAWRFCRHLAGISQRTLQYDARRRRIVRGDEPRRRTGQEVHAVWVENGAAVVDWSGWAWARDWMSVLPQAAGLVCAAALPRPRQLTNQGANRPADEHQHDTEYGRQRGDAEGDHRGEERRPQERRLHGDVPQRVLTVELGVVLPPVASSACLLIVSASE